MSDEQPMPIEPFDPADMEAWQLIIDATGVNQLMAALARIGEKAGILAGNRPPAPVHTAPAETAPEPDEVRETNGKGTPARAAAAVHKEGK